MNKQASKRIWVSIILIAMIAIPAFFIYHHFLFCGIITQKVFFKHKMKGEGAQEQVNVVDIHLK